MALSTQELTQLRDALSARESFLTQDVERETGNREAYTQLAGEAPDMGDHSVAGVIVDINRAEVARDMDELNEIADALARMQDQRYGLCIDCGGDIPFARLKVQPTAQRCIQCQALHEKTYAQEPGGASL